MRPHSKLDPDGATGQTSGLTYFSRPSKRPSVPPSGQLLRLGVQGVRGSITSRRNAMEREIPVYTVGGGAVTSCLVCLRPVSASDTSRLDQELLLYRTGLIFKRAQNPAPGRWEAPPLRPLPLRTPETLLHPDFCHQHSSSSPSALPLGDCTCSFRFSHLAMIPGTLLSTTAVRPAAGQGCTHLWPSPGCSNSAPNPPPRTCPTSPP